MDASRNGRTRLLSRRGFLTTAAILAAERARAATTALPAEPSGVPPIDCREAFIDWMVSHRGEEPVILVRRWERYRALRLGGDLAGTREALSFLLTPRETFVPPQHRPHAYDREYIDIGFGATISGPQLVARMTSGLSVEPGQRVLEIGTGSGYQAAILSHLTPDVRSIEIVPQLAARSRSVLDDLVAQGHLPATIEVRQGDGYGGWPEAVPFDRIVVTCGTDHVPKPLLAQLRVGGVMVIPIGQSRAYRVLRITKSAWPDGSIRLAQSDLFGGRTHPFVAFKRSTGREEAPAT